VRIAATLTDSNEGVSSANSPSLRDLDGKVRP
jgi:hypothetical protein